MAVTSDVTDENIVTIHIDGRFDFSIHQDFLSAYKDYPKGERRYIVDLENAEYMDSSAMGMLLRLRDYASKSGQVELRNGNDGIMELLKIANFDKLFAFS